MENQNYDCFKNHKCFHCGRKATQQFTGLFHCKCGISYVKRGRVWDGFERTSDMIFSLTKSKPHKVLITVKNKELF